jgi:hypothetical protein
MEVGHGEREVARKEVKQKESTLRSRTVRATRERTLIGYTRRNDKIREENERR